MNGAEGNNPVPEEIANGPEGLPEDLFTNPAKYDGDIPLWRRTVGLVKQYQTARPKNRGALLDQFAQPLVKNLADIGQVLENFNLIAQIKPDEDIETIQGFLGLHLESAISRRGSLASWTPERIDELIWLGLGASARTRPMIERMKTALFNAPQSVGEAVDLFYNATYAMVETPDPEIREEIFSILCLETPVLTDSSVSAIAYQVGMYSADDDHLSKYAAIQYALHEVGKLLEMGDFYKRDLDEDQGNRVASRRFEEADKKLSDALGLAENEAIVKKLMDSQFYKNPARSEKLNDYWYIHEEDALKTILSMFDAGLSPVEAELRYLNDVSKRDWPENIIKNPNDPVRKLIREYLRKFTFKALWEQYRADYLAQGYQRLLTHPIAITDNFVLSDILAQDCETPEQKTAVIKRVLDTIMAKKEEGENSKEKTRSGTHLSEEAFMLFDGAICAFDDGKIIWTMITALTEEEIGRLSSMLEYHRPAISIEQLDAIGPKLAALRNDLQNKFTRSVGKRGVLAIIADPGLKRLGYQEIDFQQGPKGDINVALRFINIPEPYEFTLDSEYRIKLGKDVQRFVSPQDQAWLELLTLSHLKKVLCTQEEDVPNELVGGQEQYASYRKQGFHIREHLRWYKNSKRKYTQEAFLNCLKSGYPIKNLHEINRMRAEINWGGTAETGYWTYVKGAEIDIDTLEAKPVRVAYKNVADDIREVIPLGEVSPEEIARIEQEILSELAI